ncbi:hypothetical protein ACFPRA_17955 [Sporosarcina soli]|uniref:YhfM-like domain-containing protein n=1 Tax=Sporosarcina soli TaxID=334736 RepID=A0ABW0TQW9_9BACL
MRKLFLGLIMGVLFMSGCSAGASMEDEKVSVYEMKSFAEIRKNSLITFTDTKVETTFAEAFHSAERVPGIVDMADPDYRVEFGDEAYFLWMSEEHGTIMNTNDTHTIYTLSKSSVKMIYELLNQ